MKKNEKFKKWQNSTLKNALKKFPERGKFFTSWNKEIKRLYFDSSDEFPGEFPFTRGIQPTMYRARLWTTRQYAGFGNSKDTNTRFKQLLSKGQNGLSIAFDLPTQLGLDPDSKQAEGEVGRIGVSVATLKDFEEIFDGIKIDKISTSMTINSTAIILLAMYVALSRKQNISPDKIAGTLQNDILKEFIARGTQIFPIEQSMKLVIDIIEYCTKNLPQMNFISVSGYHIREKGANAIQELSYTIANAIEYSKFAIKRGLKFDDFAPRMSFFFASQITFFEEIAKFRAARRIWAKLAKKLFKSNNAKSLAMKFHTQTAGSSLYPEFNKNNITRTAIEALAAIIGGTQSLHTNSFDEAESIPSSEAVEYALMTQQIIANETDVTSTVDPIGGSYFVESLTNEIEKECIKEIKKIQEMGGMINAIKSGYIEKEIDKASYKKYMEIYQGKRKIIGHNTNFFPKEENDLNSSILKYDETKKQAEKIRQIRKKRDNNKVKNALMQLKKDIIKKDVNLVEDIIKCVECYSTIGEITDILKKYL